MKASDTTALDAKTRQLRRRATAASVTVASTLAILKLGGWIATESVIVLSSLADSVVDLAASLLLFYVVSVAGRPADHGHRFGHGKAEPLGALTQSAMLAASAWFIAASALDRIVHGSPVQAPATGVAVLTVSLALSLALLAYQSRVIKITGSLAIRADRSHYVADLATGVASILALVTVSTFDAHWIDPTVGMAVAAYLAWTATSIARESIHQLMDREWEPRDRDRLVELIRGVAGVQGVHDLRTRIAGPTRFVECHVEIDGTKTLTESHAIADSIEAAITSAFPDTEVLIHQEPIGIKDVRREDLLEAP